MNKKEKRLVAAMLAYFLYNEKEKEYRRYLSDVVVVLTKKFELFATDYNKTVKKPIEEIKELTLCYLNELENGTFRGV